MSDKKTLVAYFSCTGTTKEVAETLAETTGGALFMIRPKIPYTMADLNWMNRRSRCAVEAWDPARRPEIALTCPDMADYDVVFLGFPLWWNAPPRIISTFLESYDFSGKIIVPFATADSSRYGETDKKLQDLCPDTVQWRPGRLLDPMMSNQKLTAWIDSLQL